MLVEEVDYPVPGFPTPQGLQTQVVGGEKGDGGYENGEGGKGRRYLSLR